MPKINPNRDAQIAAYTWAVGEFQETVDFATRWEQDIKIEQDELPHLPHLIQLAKSELARRANNGRKPIGREPMTPTERSAKRHAAKKRSEKLAKENAD